LLVLLLFLVGTLAWVIGVILDWLKFNRERWDKFLKSWPAKIITLAALSMVSPLLVWVILLWNFIDWVFPDRKSALVGKGNTDLTADFNSP
jgi:hypothetical protein